MFLESLKHKSDRFRHHSAWKHPMFAFAKILSSTLLVEGTEIMEGMRGFHDLAPESFLSPIMWFPKVTLVTPVPHLFSCYLQKDISLIWSAAASPGKDEWPSPWPFPYHPPLGLSYPLWVMQSRIPLDLALSTLSKYLYFSLSLKMTSCRTSILFYIHIDLRTSEQ